MTRAAALTSCLALGLLCFVPACDGSEADDDTTTGETGSGQPCGTEWAEKSGTGESVMDEWGAPCMQNSDCEPILGADAQCITNILGVYDLPGGFCSKFCELPDTMTTFVHDSPDCDPNGGVTCVGAKDLYTSCIIPCDTNDQCGREGYGCRTMPTLASEGDPTFCLMNTLDCCSTDSGECAP